MADSGICSTAQEIDDLPAGHWCEIKDLTPTPEYPFTDSQLFNAAPTDSEDDPAVHPGNPTKVGNVMAYSGGAYDTHRDYLIVWGGGHTDYAGNEIYGFNVNSLQWKRITEPTLNVDDDSCDVGTDENPGTFEYPDQTPCSVHTYDYIVYVPSIDRFCSLGGASPYPHGGNKTVHVHCNNFADSAGVHRGWALQSSMPHPGGTGGLSAYDPVKQHAWYFGYSADEDLMKWEPASNSWQVRTPKLNIGSSKMSAEIDPLQRVFVLVGEGSASKYFNIDDTGELTWQLLNTSGPTFVSSAKGPGFEFDSVSKQLIGWAGGTSVYALDVAARQWKECPVADTNGVSPGAQNQNGTYGRFQYIPSKNVFIVVNHYKKNVFIYRLSASCGGSGETDSSPPSVPSGLVVE